MPPRSFHILLALFGTFRVGRVASQGVVTARERAPQIFNAIHNAMRQWGSSVHHNGMSLFPVRVPVGNLFYHGTILAERRKGGPEWLSFEPEHAAGFSRSWEADEPRPWQDTYRSTLLRTGSQRVFDTATGPPRIPPGRAVRGHFHTYAANRSLRLIYIDGMSAGNSEFGSMDTQDLVLIDGFDGDTLDDWERASKICSFAQSAGADGMIRMEAGFEVVYCDFEDGLDIVSIMGQRNARTVSGTFEWMRASAERYEGFEPGRFQVDWSGMVSALWHSDINITNPDPLRPDLPRLSGNPQQSLRPMANRFHEVLKSRQEFETVHWQAVTDRIDAMFGPRLEAMARSSANATTIRHQVDSLLDRFTDFSPQWGPRRRRIVDACASRHLRLPLVSETRWTPEDMLIFKHWTLRKMLDPPTEDARGAAKELVKNLIDWLDWARWRRCDDKCEHDNKLCFIAMFPFGTAEDHFTPRCKSAEEIAQAMDTF
ncbi:hypothetical protein BKA62DRAFT_712225 [Auriculariales sp. MPI-PUGE-AT-0066]|nr:hypothetical protein BKA62DRAFT_712225 [Auriculariales sp. MPI-PUGE-AT-0066]